MAARDAKPSITERNPLVSYAIAAAGVILAATSAWWWAPIHRALGGPILADTPPVRLVLVLAVLAAAWRGGLGPGLFATVLGIATIVTANDAPGDVATLVTRLLRFGSLALLLSLSFGALYRARRRSALKEQEFHRSEGRYRRLVETAGEGIWVIDRHGRTTYANPRLGELLGVQPHELLGLSFKTFLVDPRDAAGHWWDPPNGVLSWHEIRLRALGGDVRHTVVSARPLGRDEFSGDGDEVPAEEVRGFLLMVTDVTPLKKTEEALREKETVLRSFYESSVMAMGVVELDGGDTRFVSANGLTDSFFGLEPGKLEGRTAQQVKAPPEMVSTWNDRFRECMATGRPVRFEYQGNCPSSPSWVAATLSPMRNSSSGRSLCSFIVEDITERKRTEEDLRKAKELAEAASHAKDRFLAVLSHELRTPLTPALIAVSSLVESKAMPSILPTLEMIRRNIELEARLIDDLLDLSRIVRGRLRLEYEVVDIHQAIRRSMEICRDETLVAGLHVLTDLRAPQHHVSADHARIMQVIWNLIRNAAKFTPAGGRLTIRTSNFAAAAGPGDASAEGPLPRLAIEFEDTGVGIEAAVLTRIFNPFEQGDEPLRGRAGGLGLGLAISRSLAEAMGGRLVASSPGRGQGSVFRLELAAVAAPLATRAGIAAPSQSPAIIGGRTLHILMVEDNKDTLRYLSAILRQRGHVVTAADCVAAASAESP
jgi:two-component system CheB/CheR fusion protein